MGKATTTRTRTRTAAPAPAAPAPVNLTKTPLTGYPVRAAGVSNIAYTVQCMRTPQGVALEQLVHITQARNTTAARSLLADVARKHPVQRRLHKGKSIWYLAPQQ